MKPAVILSSTLCSFLLSFSAWANEESNKHENAAPEPVENEKTEDEAMDFPDEPYWPPAEGEFASPPWSKHVGYDEGFFIRNADDTFSLFFNGLLQVRYIYSTVEGLPDYQRFQLRRTDLYFSGHFIDDSWTYVLGTEAGPDGTFAADDVYIAKNFTDFTWGQAGQFSTPFLRETLISSTRQLTVERSLVSKYFSTNNSTGLLFGTEGDEFKWQIAATNGYFEHDPNQNQNVIDEHDFQNGMTYSFISRLELKPIGDWAEFRGFNSPSDNDTGLLIGIAAAYQRDNDVANIEETSATIDATLQGSGWSTFGMFAATKDQNNDHGTSYGAQLQGGLFVDEEGDTVELFSRYEWGHSKAHAEPLPEFDSENLSVLTGGFNYYIYPSHLKVTTDLGYAFTSIGENWSDETDGWRATDEKGQWVGRVQLQLVI